MSSGPRGDATRFPRLLLATGRQLVRPRSAAEWSFAFVVVLVAVVAWWWKRSVQAVFEGRGGPVAASLADFANVAGAGAVMFAVVLGVLVVGWALSRETLVEVAFVVGAGGAWCWTLLRVGQFVLAEHRPVEGGAMGWFRLDGHGISGHAAVAALLVAPICKVLGRNARPSARAATAIGVAVWALFVGWSRMWLGMHFLWNVVLGFALGWLTGHASVKAWRALSRS